MFSDHFDEYEKLSVTDSDGSYSDQISSDVEAELYGLIHHERNEEFSTQTPNSEMFNSEDGSNHKEHISAFKHSSFGTDDNSYLKLYKSFETTNKSFLPTQSNHGVSSENLLSKSMENSAAKHFSFNDTNKRKQDSFDVDENQNRIKSFATDDSSSLKLNEIFETRSKSFFSTPQSHHGISSENSLSESLENSAAKYFSFNDTNKRKRDSFDVDQKKTQKKSFATDDYSDLKLNEIFKNRCKTFFSTPQSHHGVSSENSLSESMESSAAKYFSFNDSNKTKKDSFDVGEKKTQKKSSAAPKNSVNLANYKSHPDSSDSDDSIMILEPSKDFTINLSAPDTVELSSDDSSDSDFSSLYSKLVGSDLNSQRNRFSSSIKKDRNISDPWHINNEDLYRTGKNSKFGNRYHDKMLQKCSNCNENGHLARACTEPQKVKCFFCGGPHIANFCEKTICSKCYRRGHNRRRCYQKGTQSCSLCNMYGHVRKNCPDIWRRYHLTTSNSKFIRGHRLKQDVPLYCFNCGVKGHFGSECPRSRMESYDAGYPTWPRVVSYTAHENVLRQERENSGGWRDRQRSSHQEQPRSKHDERSQNENMNHKHQSILINNEVNERTPDANAKHKRKSFKQKKILKLQSDQKLVKESNFPRSPRQNILTIEKERLKKTHHLPSSSNISPIDDVPLLAQKKTLKNRERRRRRGINLKSRELNKSI